MKVLLVIDWRRTTLGKIGAKFASGEDALPPEGVTMLSRWHDLASKRAWVVVETDDTAKIQSWTGAWADYVDFTTHTVLDDDGIGPVLEDLLSR